jgi:ubiquitin carboxyl-terminal hydrolase 14
VKFPTEFDALDLVTEDLKAKLQPASRRLMEVEKERRDRRKIRKRTKAETLTQPVDVAIAGSHRTTEPLTVDVDIPIGPDPSKLEEESVYRERERAELEALISPDVKGDIGASATGLYDLVGESPRLIPPQASSDASRLGSNYNA